MQSYVQSINRQSWFKFSADHWPVAIILMLSIVDFVMYFAIDNLAVFCGYYLIMIIPKGVISAWNHHHQHVLTLRSNALNRLLEFFYALHTGVTTHLWRLHHVLGHHKNFLDQEKDESRWRRKDGSQMGVVEYTLNVAITAYPRGFKVGKQHPKLMNSFLMFTAITFSFVAVMVWHKPVAGIFLFILPMITSLIFTAYVTYEHHAGLDTENEFTASYNSLNPLFNRLTGNLGYHTAHHHKQGVHWSNLPQLHASIADKIPDNLIQQKVVTRRVSGGG